MHTSRGWVCAYLAGLDRLSVEIEAVDPENQLGFISEMDPLTHSDRVLRRRVHER